MASLYHCFQLTSFNPHRADSGLWWVERERNTRKRDNLPLYKYIEVPERTKVGDPIGSGNMNVLVDYTIYQF
jgi:hypothetical protein